MTARCASLAQRTVLVVDDDDALRVRLVRAFEARGFAARGACNAGEAMALARTESPELAVVDLCMPGGSGLELVRDLAELDPATNVVVLTGYGSIATALEAVRLGAAHYLSKPADVDDLLAAFARAKTDRTADPLPIAHTVPTLARTEWEHIQRVLADCGGNVTRAARLLGIHRRSLQRKLARTP
ncbi:MAG: response regulator [Deltaproteobacteria bacterium]|nr:response regulator [Deltaproteobacteria bacterium]